MNKILIIDADGHTWLNREVSDDIEVWTEQLEDGVLVLHIGSEEPEEFAPEEFEEIKFVGPDGQTVWSELL